MAIDFSFPEEIELVRTKVREFCDQVVRPAEKEIEAHEGDRKVLVEQVTLLVVDDFIATGLERRTSIRPAADTHDGGTERLGELNCDQAHAA